MVNWSSFVTKGLRVDRLRKSGGFSPYFMSVFVNQSLDSHVQYANLNNSQVLVQHCPLCERGCRRWEWLNSVDEWMSKYSGHRRSQWEK